MERRSSRGSWRSTWSVTRAATRVGELCYTLTVTDIATGWTENRSVRNKAQKWVFAALIDITAVFPFPILGIDSDNGSEFINEHLLRCCDRAQITFTRSRPGQQQRRRACGAEELGGGPTVVGYHRYDTPPSWRC